MAPYSFSSSYASCVNSCAATTIFSEVKEAFSSTLPNVLEFNIVVELFFMPEYEITV